MNWVDYRDKLGIGFDDSAKYSMLKNKVSILLDTMGSSYSEASYRAYSMMVGEPMLNQGTYPYNGLKVSIISRSNSIIELISKYIAFLNTYREEDYDYHYSPHNVPYEKSLLLKAIKSFLDDLRIQYEIIEDKDGSFLFPKGVKEFDDALVSQPLLWLSVYPNSEKAWCKALHEYSEGASQNASDIADLFRKALEAFFQEFFQSGKSLENYKSEYGDYLKQKGIPKEITSNFETLLQAYTNFINNYAKHKDATSDKVLEYLMYQTGNIIRLLITL